MIITTWEKEYGNHTAKAHVITDDDGYHVETGDRRYDKSFKTYKGAAAYLERFGYTEKSTTIYLSYM